MTNTTGSRRRASDPLVTANRSSRLRTVVLSASLVVAATGMSWAQANSSASPTQTASACATYGSWIDVKTGQPIDRGGLFRDLVAKAAVVLLGESHTDADHHRWQLHTLAALHGRGGNLVIGFEAFPRRLQSVLGDWVEGKLTDDAFLKASEWRQVWEGVPAAEREGLSDPAPASPAYQRELARVYLFKKAIPPGADPFSGGHA